MTFCLYYKVCYFPSTLMYFMKEKNDNCILESILTFIIRLSGRSYKRIGMHSVSGCISNIHFYTIMMYQGLWMVGPSLSSYCSMCCHLIIIITPLLFRLAISFEYKNTSSSSGILHVHGMVLYLL